MPRNRGEQVLVYVPVTVNNYKYGFKTNEKKFNAIGATLGQKLADVPGIFFGANSPKPGIARKKEKNGSISSFFDIKKEKTLKKEGWLLSATGTTKGIRTSGLAITVCVDTPWGYKYAWNITKAELPLFQPYGVEVPTDSDKLVWGSFPKPPRATKREAKGTSSSFIKPSQATATLANNANFSVTSIDPRWGSAP
jgi:hypothetical protein